MNSARRSFALALLAAICASAPLLAQDAKPIDHSASAAKPHDTAHTSAPSTGMLTRNAFEMKRLLRAMEGTWKTTTHMEPSAWSPKPISSHGTSIIKPGPGGLSVIQDFKSLGDLGPYAGHGVLWFDAKAGAFNGFWCDSMSPTSCGNAGTGTWEGDNKLVVKNTESAPDGKTMDIVTTYTFSSDAFTSEYVGGPTGQPAKKMMTIEYKRIGKAPVPLKRPTGKE